MSRIIITLAFAVLTSACQDINPFPVRLPGGGNIAPVEVCIEVPGEGSSFERAFRAKCGVGVRIRFGGSASSSLVAPGGASSLSLDPGRSNLPVPAGTPVTVTLRNSSETMLGQQTFATSVVSGRLKAANPYAVDAWINSYGSSAVIAEVEFGPFEVEQNDGENRMIFDARINGTVASSIVLDSFSKSESDQGVGWGFGAEEDIEKGDYLIAALSGEDFS